MEIHYNETEQTLKINDERKNQLIIVNFVSIVNIFNAIVWITKAKNDFGLMEAVWLLIGCISVGALYYTLFTQSKAEKIPLSSIKKVKSYTIFGKKRYALQLTNGKSRSLANIKTTAEIEEMLALFSKVGVPA